MTIIIGGGLYGLYAALFSAKRDARWSLNMIHILFQERVISIKQEYIWDIIIQDRILRQKNRRIITIDLLKITTFVFTIVSIKYTPFPNTFHGQMPYNLKIL